MATNTVPASSAIHEGQIFADRFGMQWKVIEVKPFGRVDLFCDARTCFCETTHRDVKANYTRVPNP